MVGKYADRVELPDFRREADDQLFFRLEMRAVIVYKKVKKVDL